MRFFLEEVDGEHGRALATLVLLIPGLSLTSLRIER